MQYLAWNRWRWQNKDFLRRRRRVKGEREKDKTKQRRGENTMEGEGEEGADEPASNVEPRCNCSFAGRQQVLRMSSLQCCCTDLDLEVDESGFGSTRNEAPVHSIASNAGAKGAVVVVKLLEQLNKTILI
ncbi:uncharacterized protein [Arachis hypogaea]|uniref:uncharacterized protein n=1 Tax=Arachis hypogaea TaxID=3818 RepID=UPI0034E7B692